MAKGCSTSSKTKSMKFIPLFMFILNFQYLSHGAQEEEVLLSFKASLHDPLHFLSNWNTSSATLCKWHGISCDNNVNSSHVNAVMLSGKSITGEISSSIFQLPYVTNLDLSNNQFVGEITFNYSLNALSQLRYLNLSNNNLTGSLPQPLFSVLFSNLETLDLSNNMFSGSTPDQIGLLSSLRYLDLGGNVLVGKIPNSITNITTLEYLTFASNQLVDKIPEEIGVMKSLKWIYLGYNNLSGEIPSGIGKLLSLNHLDLVYNNLSGPIPQSLGHLTELQYLFLYQNKLSGPIPLSIFEMKKLISLDLSDNSFSGEISEHLVQLQRLEILHLFSNKFTGKIPKGVASLPRLQILQLWSNGLTGEIPEELGKHSNLTVLDLSTNKLTGKIPDHICDHGSLFKLILFSNSFQGEIPKSITSCRSLRRVRLQNNNLSGILPSELTTLPQVYYFEISGNQLSGRIDDRKWDMPSLQMLSLANNNFSGEIPNSFGTQNLEDLDLSHNQFSGSIPIGFKSLSELVELKLSNNNLFGNFPEEICSCKKLVVLDLSNNQLSGEIPMKLSDMPVLSLLDLSENQFSGEIPQNLGSEESLVQVNISHNNFHGALPSTGAFLAIKASAVTGNNLCDRDGGDSSGLPRCKNNNQNSTWFFTMLCFLLAFVAFSTASFLVFYVRRRKNFSEVRKVVNEDGTWEVEFIHTKAARLINVEDVLLAVKKGKVVSKGRNWISYEGKCLENDMQFVVKEIIDLSSLPMSMWEDTVKFGKVRHPNLVNLIGRCKCGKRGYLVYEHEEGKKLSEIMNSLSWQQRCKIAFSVAKVLKFLHSHASSIILVGEVSPKIVWVDGKGVPRLKVTPPVVQYLDVKDFVSSPYISQEAREREKSREIYGFGVMVIELLTGRSTMDIEAGNGMPKTIVEWARYCYSDCHLDTWIDPMMKGGDALSCQNDMVEMMNLALHCTATDPTARPCARDVLRALETVHRTTFC